MGTENTNRKKSGCWQRRSLLEKTLCVFVILATLIIVCLCLAIFGLISSSLNKDDPSQENVCLTESCINSASFLLKSMDQKIDPCEDFYSYACGKYLATTQIPDNKPGVSRFSELSVQVTKQLRLLLEEEEEPNQPYHIKITKQLYKACMNTSGIEQRGLKPLLDMLKRLGGWPVLEGDQWNPETFYWLETYYKFRRNGFTHGTFIEFAVVVDSKNNKQHIIRIYQPWLGLSREYLTKGAEEPHVQAYLSYMVDIAVLLGADKHRAEEEMTQVLEFEMQLANITLSREEQLDNEKLYNPITIEELQFNISSIPWLSYFNTLLPAESQVNETETVIVTAPQYLQRMEPLLAETDKRVIANYMFWLVVYSSVSKMTEALLKRQLEYYAIFNGKTQLNPRWEKCGQVVSNSLYLSVGSLFVSHYFDKGSKDAALQLVNDIRMEMIESLKDADWMDEITRKRAIEKAKNMGVHIGYPDELLDSEKISKFYRGIRINPNKYFESKLNVNKFETNFYLRRLREPVNKTEWFSHGFSAIVNAFYNAKENSMEFPAAILQGIFFDKRRPHFMNYGVIGGVIGHEITHGFDDEGSQYDSDGNLNDWWEPETRSHYLEKTKCFIYQSGNFTEPQSGLNLNGIMTQGENIADSGGLRIAYKAYTKWLARQKKTEATLPGLPSLTPQKAFWISAIQTECAKNRKEGLRTLVINGYHSPPLYRGNAPLWNAPEFAKDFECPEDSPMNPPEKCRIF